LLGGGLLPRGRPRFKGLQAAATILLPRHTPNTWCRRQQGLHLTLPRHVYSELEPKETPAGSGHLYMGSKVKKLNFPPFVKELYLGRFNKSILSYAEVLNYERHSILEQKVAELRKYMDSKAESLDQVQATGRLPPEVMHTLLKSGFHGMSLPKEAGGEDLLATEVARMYEELGRHELSLAESVCYAEYQGGAHLVLRHGTEAQQAKYLPALAAGDWRGAMCLHEESAGSDPMAVRCEALEIEEDGENFLLNGVKTWVAGAEGAQLFIVFALTQGRNYLGEREKQLSALLVDRGYGGVEVSSPYSTAAMKGLMPATVTFNNCKVPKTAVLGELGGGAAVLQSVLHKYKYMSGAGVLASAKTLLDETIQHCNTRKQYGLQLSEFTLVKHQLAQCAARIYCLEAMLYLTAALEDVSDDPDVEVESAIVKEYAVEAYDFVVKNCLQLLGIDKVNHEESRYQKYLKEAMMLKFWQGTSNINKCFIGVSGVIHLIENEKELQHLRQPLMHWAKFLKYKLSHKRHYSDSHPLDHKLYNCVHPRLQISAEKVEWAVMKIPFVTKELLSRVGANIQVEEANLERLADMSIEVFAMVAALSRASRSYIVGHPHSEHEVNLAISYIHEARLRVKTKAWECLKGRDDEDNRDGFWVSSADYMTRRGAYQPVHPLTKNSF